MSIRTPEQLDRDLHGGVIQSIYLFCGPEDYLIQQALSRLKKTILNPETIAFNYTELNAASSSAGEIMQALGTLPLLSEHRLVLVEQVQEMKGEDRDILISYFDKPYPNSSLVLVATDVDRRTSFYRSLKDKACIVNFPRLKGYELARWAEQYVRSGGFRISSTTVRRVIDLVGSNLQTLVSEFQKLMLYSAGKNTISIGSVDNLVAKSRHHGIFELTDAVGRRDLSAALRLIGNLTESGEPPLVIVTMLARHLRQLIIAKELLDQGRKPNEISRLAKIPGFLIEEYIRQVRSIDPELARDLYHRLAEADLRLKSSGIHPRLVLESLVYSLGRNS